MNSLIKKAIAEFIGTFVLVFFAVGTAVVTGGDVVATSLAFGLVIVGMAYSVGRISGCHLNPAVSVGCLLTNRMTVKEFLVYVCSQILGAIAGGVVLFSIFKLGLGYEKTAFVTLGSNLALNGKFAVKSVIGAAITEVILTFVFVYVILNVTDDKATEGDEYKRGTSQIAGIIIGLTLVLVHLIGINLTGTSVNPARSIGTALADLIFSGKITALKHLAIFIFAPIFGSALAAAVYFILHKSED